MQDYLGNIRAHANAEYPRECCGLLVRTSTGIEYKPCANMAIGDMDFSMSPIDYVRYTKDVELLAIVHSHCFKDANPTTADIQCASKMTTPWLIYSVPKDQFVSFNKDSVPLLGRQYAYGVTDCWTLVEDAYKEVGIDLGIEKTTQHHMQNWFNLGFDLMGEEAFNNAGFRKLKSQEPLETLDVVTMSLGRTKVPNHCGVWYKPNLLLHHQSNKLSNKEVYGGYWLKNTRAVYRRM